jgi:hypothetical protein
MYYFNARVTIGPYVWPHLSEFETRSSWRTLGDTATLKLGGLRKNLERLITTGMAAKVECGYDGQYFTEFEGYVAEILPNVPFTLRLEDEAYRLKREQVGDGHGNAWKHVTLKEVLRYLYDGPLSGSVPDVDLSPFRLDRMSKYKALDKIREEFGLTIYFRGKTLFAGLAYSDRQATDVVVYRIAGSQVRGLPPNVVDTDLTYKGLDDVRLGIRAISITPDNKRLEVKVGDSDGDQVTMHFYNIKSEAVLKKLATERLNLTKFEGYRGGLTSFGIPRVEHGMAAQLRDVLYPEREMKVFVDEVKVTVSKSGGFRRQVTFGRKAS